MSISVGYDPAADLSSSRAAEQAQGRPAYARAGVLVHYHEIALKGENRRFFEKRLQRNISRATRAHQVTRVERITGILK